MEILIFVGGIIAIAFVFGLLSRNKGDGVLDTLGSGCNTILSILAILGLIAFAISQGWFK